MVLNGLFYWSGCYHGDEGRYYGVNVETSGGFLSLLQRHIEHRVHLCVGGIELKQTNKQTNVNSQQQQINE